MKILFVTDLCPITKNEKGLPLALFNFISDFKKLGHDVTLLRPNVSLNVLIRGRKIYPEGEYVYEGIKCINKNFLTPFFKTSDFKFLKNEGYEIILSHMPSGVLAANKISKLLDIPYLAAVHSSDIKVLTDIKYSFLWYTVRKCYKEARNVVCRSYWLKDKIEKLIPEVKNKAYVIPSGISSEEIAPREIIDNKLNNFYGIPYKMLSAGSLIKRKNFKSLIDAVAEFDDIELKIAGDGKLRESLQKRIRNKKNKAKIKLLGKKKREEVLGLMEETPIFILPSLNETFGLVFLEAMAKGCIVVCPEDSGMAGFIKDGFNGFLTKTDTKSIKATIERIKEIKNPEYIMNNALDTAIETERIKMAENYLKLIQNILF